MPRVLIVEDEPGIRFALKRWFERQQWQVDEAHDGQQAFDLVSAAVDRAAATDVIFDVIVSDLHLPRLSGEELVRALHTLRPVLATRVILTTGDAVQDAAHDSVLASHPHVLQKPFDLGMLRAAIERILS